MNPKAELERYVRYSSARLYNTLKAMVAWQGLTCECNPFGSSFVSFPTVSGRDGFALYITGSGRN